MTRPTSQKGVMYTTIMGSTHKSAGSNQEGTRMNEQEQEILDLGADADDCLIR